MNIFALDPCPILSAQMMCDQHVNKMILESAQMLSTELHRILPEGHVALQNAYKPTHRQHPCTLWLSKSWGNVLWTCAHVNALEAERFYRFGRTRQHRSTAVAIHVATYISTLRSKLGDTTEQTPFALAMPEQYKCGCPHESYRRYYSAEKMHLGRNGGPSTWTNRRPPSFTAY